jgi:hypothetical protein
MPTLTRARHPVAITLGSVFLLPLQDPDSFLPLIRGGGAHGYFISRLQRDNGALPHGRANALLDERDASYQLALQTTQVINLRKRYQLALQTLLTQGLRLFQYPSQYWVPALLVRQPIWIDPFIRHDARRILLLKLIELSRVRYVEM